MAVTSGTGLGPYAIVAPLGAGAMGEVYRATDTNLDREVAIKVLPASFALDGDRVARFTRDAKTLASLNHPNIAAIYGLEKTPDLTALVMELVEGEDLSAVIARGPIARPDALPFAKQVAEALEHRFSCVRDGRRVSAGPLVDRVGRSHGPIRSPARAARNVASAATLARWQASRVRRQCDRGHGCVDVRRPAWGRGSRLDTGWFPPRCFVRRRWQR